MIFRGTVVAAVATLLTSVVAYSQTATNKTKEKMGQFILEPLPYKADALAPIISEQTINFHYGKHLATYVSNLNKLIEGTEFQDADLHTIIKAAKGPTFNNAAQVYNHQFYFATFSPSPKDLMAGELRAAIEKKWGSVEDFKREFTAAGVSIFGSGWVWLAKDAKGELSILKCGNAENPLTQSLTPLLTADVWEHSYYLDYQNRRADHLAEIWKLVDWSVVNDRYNK